MEPPYSLFKDQLFGHYYRFFSEKAVYQSFLRQIETFKLGIRYYEALNIIFKSRYWEKRGFDGKTLVRDRYAGNISSFFHDYPSRMGFGCKENDAIFLYLELKGGASRRWSLIQYKAVRLATPFFSLRDHIKGRRQPKPQWLKDLYIETIIRLKKEFDITI